MKVRDLGGLRRLWRSGLLAAAMVVTLGPGRTASAQDADCHCSCYFFLDCEEEHFCDWGVLRQEDTCWWRQPKPFGQKGAGCDQDIGEHGKCDGVCEPRTVGANLVAGERRADLWRGVSLWARAFDEAALSGGGAPSAESVGRIESIGFLQPSMPYGLWRMVVEVMILSRGWDFVVLPEADAYAIGDVAVGDLRDDPVRRRNGELAVRVVLAEIERAGAGRELLAGFDLDRLDDELFDRICPSGDRRSCLYTRLATIGDVLGRGAADAGERASAGADEPLCAGCPGDCDPSDEIDFADLLMLLGDWGSAGCGDVNQDGVVSFDDLLALLSRWGPCALPK